MGVTGVGKIEIGEELAEELGWVFYNGADFHPQANIDKINEGIPLTDEDRLRREIIMQLICHFTLDIPRLEKKWKIQFMSHFAAECHELEGMVLDGLVSLENHILCVRPAGRLLIRNICMVFDQYLRKDSAKQKFSRVI